MLESGQRALDRIARQQEENSREVDRACRWNAFVIHLHTKYRYLLNHELAMQIAREAQEHFENE
jgi:hypothetical protein